MQMIGFLTLLLNCFKRISIIASILKGPESERSWGKWNRTEFAKGLFACIITRPSCEAVGLIVINVRTVLSLPTQSIQIFRALAFLNNPA